MREFIFCLILLVLISFSAVAKTIDQKKDELKKIYEIYLLDLFNYKY